MPGSLTPAARIVATLAAHTEIAVHLAVVEELDDGDAAMIQQVVEYVARQSDERKGMDSSVSTWRPQPGEQVRVVSTGEIGVSVEQDSSIPGEESYAVTITSSSGRLAPAGTRSVSIRHLEPWQ